MGAILNRRNVLWRGPPSIFLLQNPQTDIQHILCGQQETADLFSCSLTMPGGYLWYLFFVYLEEKKEWHFSSGLNMHTLAIHLLALIENDLTAAFKQPTPKFKRGVFLRPSGARYLCHVRVPVCAGCYFDWSVILSIPTFYSCVLEGVLCHRKSYEGST